MSDDFDVITGPAAPLRPVPPASLPPALQPAPSSPPAPASRMEKPEPPAPQ
jgi:hypothetical protein